ncbi:MAG: VWA domain-containing protein [candidate division Zixibacteria bacterium]|nr:VWA domain-containing protein [candidate division Zixibacteria bacterium]
MKVAQVDFIYVLLILLPLLIVFYWFVFRMKRRAKERFGNLGLVEKLSLSFSPKKQRWKVALILLGTLFLLFSLARPQLGTKLTLMKREGVDIVIAMDVSFSMMAEDIRPNRLEKAKQEVNGLIGRMRGDRVGLVAFAGVPFVQCPLTLDYSAAKMFLDIIDVNLIPQPGTAIGDAIRTSIGAFNQKERKYKVLILLTDGEDHDSDPLGAAEEASKEGIRIYTIGIGSVQGEPIPIKDNRGRVTGFKKDKEESVVVSKLDEVTLQKIALISGGKYYHATSGEMELDKIYDEISKMEKKELEGKLLTQYEDRYQYFLLVSVILLSIEFLLSEKRSKKAVDRLRAKSESR